MAKREMKPEKDFAILQIDDRGRINISKFLEYLGVSNGEYVHVSRAPQVAKGRVVIGKAGLLDGKG